MTPVLLDLLLGNSSPCVPVRSVEWIDVANKIARWTFGFQFAGVAPPGDQENGDWSNFLIDGAGPLDIINFAPGNFLDMTYAAAGTTWSIQDPLAGDFFQDGFHQLIAGQTGATTAIPITVLSLADNGDGTCELVVDGPVEAGVAGADSGLTVNDGADDLPALSYSNIRADTPSSGQTTVTVGFL